MLTYLYFLIHLVVAYPLVQRVNLDRIPLRSLRDLPLAYTTILRYLLLGYIIVFFPELNSPAVASVSHGSFIFLIENYYVSAIRHRAVFFMVFISAQRVAEWALYRKIAGKKTATIAKAILGASVFFAFGLLVAPRYSFFVEYAYYPIFGVINSLTNTWVLWKVDKREPVRISRVAKYSSLILLPMVLVINYPKLRKEIQSSYFFPSCSLTLETIDYLVKGYDRLGENAPTSMDAFIHEVLHDRYLWALKCPYSEDDQEISYEYFNPKNLRDEAKGERFIVLYEKPDNHVYREGGRDERTVMFSDGYVSIYSEEKVHELLLKQSKSPDAFVWEPSSGKIISSWVHMKREAVEGAKRRAVTPIAISFLVFIAASIFTYWPRPKNDKLSESELKNAV